MTDRKKHKGLLSGQTIMALTEADRALSKAYDLLEHAGILVSEDVAGDSFNEAAQDAAPNVHPIYRHVWETLARAEDDYWTLREYLKLELNR